MSEPIVEKLEQLYIWNANARIFWFQILLGFFSRLAEILCYFWFTYISELDKVTTINLFDIKYVSWKNWLVEWTSNFFPRHCIHILDIPHNWPLKSLYRSPAGSKKIVERRHGEPIKFLFLPKMGLLGSQASTEKKIGCEFCAKF